MNKFLKRVFIITIIGLIIASVLDYTISVNLKSSDYFGDGEILIWKEIFNGNINDEILIYGSSRAMVHFDPEIMEDSLGLTTYNLGINGHNFWLQHLRHKKVLEYNNRPKYIILSLGLSSLRKREDLYNLDQFLPFIYDWDIYKYTSSYKGYTIFDYILPLYRYSGKQKVIKQVLQDNRKRAAKEPYRYKGFKAQEREWNTDFKKAKTKLKFIEITKHQPSEELMKQFLAECKALEIKVIMVYSPEYIDGQNFVKNRNEIINTYENMATQNDFSFLNFSDDKICLDKSLFYNSQHLNARGAKLFSEKLVAEIKKMNLIQKY